MLSWTLRGHMTLTALCTIGMLQAAGKQGSQGAGQVGVKSGRDREAMSCQPFVSSRPAGSHNAGVRARAVQDLKQVRAPSFPLCAPALTHPTAVPHASGGHV